jgi:hypothetical protein
MNFLLHLRQSLKYLGYCFMQFLFYYKDVYRFFPFSYGCKANLGTLPLNILVSMMASMLWLILQVDCTS